MKNSFKDLVAFQCAKQLMLDVYEVTRSFPREETYGLAAQLRRAAISVMANIAEGQGRATRGESRQFIGYARGSLFEIEAELIAAEHLGYIGDEQVRQLFRSVKRTGTALTGFLRWLTPATQ